MIKLLFTPSKFDFIAVSGGIDSMVLADFVNKGRHKKKIIHFNHGTEFGERAQKFVEEYGHSKNIDVISAKITSPKPKDESWEEYWRNQRYKFFNTINSKIALAHHLDDAIESYLFYCINGKSWTIPASRNNVVRPFLTTAKSELLKWSEDKNVEYLDDPSNYDDKYARSIIRHKIMPEVVKVNPGIYKVVKNMIMKNLS